MLLYVTLFHFIIFWRDFQFCTRVLHASVVFHASVASSENLIPCINQSQTQHRSLKTYITTMECFWPNTGRLSCDKESSACLHWLKPTFQRNKRFPTGHPNIDRPPRVPPGETLLLLIAYDRHWSCAFVTHTVRDIPRGLIVLWGVQLVKFLRF